MTTTPTRPDITPTALLRDTAKVIVCPVVHECHGRVTRRTWTARVVLRTDSTPAGDPTCRIDCGHHGHRTTRAAADCGTAIWRGLA